MRDIVAACAGLGLAYILAGPLCRDLPAAIQGQYAGIEGKPIKVVNRSINQHRNVAFTVQGKTFAASSKEFAIAKEIANGSAQRMRIIYLPHSDYVLEMQHTPRKATVSQK